MTPSIAVPTASCDMIEWFAATPYDGRPAIFLDRDGVINEHIAGGYVLGAPDFRWLPGVIDSLRRLAQSGRGLFFVTNQSCVNQGLLEPATLTDIMADMTSILVAAGVPVAGWLCCPHRSDEGCLCRKPGCAMLERAAAITGVSLTDAILLGDSPSDIEAASRVSMRSILVERNNARALASAVDRIVKGLV